MGDVQDEFIKSNNFVTFLVAASIDRLTAVLSSVSGGKDEVYVYVKPFSTFMNCTSVPFEVFLKDFTSLQ